MFRFILRIAFELITANKELHPMNVCLTLMLALRALKLENFEAFFTEKNVCSILCKRMISERRNIRDANNNDT